MWFRHVGQVMVAGGSNSKEKFDRSAVHQEHLSLKRLRLLRDDDIKKNIHQVLLGCGVRYVGNDLGKSAKTRALANNLAFILAFPGEFSGLMNHLCTKQSPDAEIERVYFFMDNLSYMKNKSARDCVMGTGMNQNTLAIDVRLRNIFSLLQIDLPDVGKLTSRKAYRSAELALVEQVCIPLDVAPIVLDRTMYQNYSKIMEKEYRQQRLF